MTSDQQRAVDQAIIDGRLVDAVAAYRGATGAGLTDAEQYVRNRSAGVTGAQAQAQPRMSSSSSVSPSAIKGIVVAVVVIVIMSIVVPLVITAGALAVTFNGFNLTHFFSSAMSITNEPYYPDVVREIQNDPKFKDALGAPIVVDDGKVFCNQISDNSVQHLASCTMPVHGPKGTGSVRVQIVDQATSLQLGAWLTAGGRTIPISQ
jgi:hypothetical protein